MELPSKNPQLSRVGCDFNLFEVTLSELVSLSGPINDFGSVVLPIVARSDWIGGIIAWRIGKTRRYVIIACNPVPKQR